MRGNRRRVHLQQQTETKDAYGAAIITWTTTATVWARPRMMWGTESFQADQVNAQKQINFYIPYGSEWKTIDNKWRLQDTRSLRKYEINSYVLPEHREYQSREIELMCTESERDDE